jgi:hypothetical protein
MTKVYVVLEELEDPWYGDGNIVKILDSKEKADKWIKNADPERYYRTLNIEEFDVS